MHAISPPFIGIFAIPAIYTTFSRPASECVPRLGLPSGHRRGLRPIIQHTRPIWRHCSFVTLKCGGVPVAGPIIRLGACGQIDVRHPLK